MPTPINLRATRQITWTQPPTRQEAAAIEEIDDLTALPERTPEQEERRQQLIKHLQPAPSWRFTLATMTVLQAGRYDANRRAISEWIEEVTGTPTREALETPAGRAMFYGGLQWARAAAALTQIEYRHERRINIPDGAEAANQPDEWRPLDLPAAWSQPGTALDEIPADLMQALETAAAELNPGLVGANMSAEAKKNGGVSAE